MKEEQEGWGGPSSYLVYNPTSVSSFGLLWAHPDSKITISSYFTYRKEARPSVNTSLDQTPILVLTVHVYWRQKEPSKLLQLVLSPTSTTCWHNYHQANFFCKDILLCNIYNMDNSITVCNFGMDPQWSGPHWTMDENLVRGGRWHWFTSVFSWSVVWREEFVTALHGIVLTWWSCVQKVFEISFQVRSFWFRLLVN